MRRGGNYAAPCVLQLYEMHLIIYVNLYAHSKWTCILEKGKAGIAKQKLPRTWGEAAETVVKVDFYEHFCPKNLGVATKIAKPLENTGNKQKIRLLR